ncbi:C39 family peptidase [Virgibacillus doumboii]|uniref:C39 family peptidase n=1 Tax=Virgibacillus doumboii TaxID=2697503 RepID=UPI0013DF9694|nr:C39 family peptidase [Virgibacillus doumboii]
MAKKLLIVFLCFVLLGSFFVSEGRKVSASNKKVKIKGVPEYHQFPQLPTGCEATSLAMLLSWGGEDFGKYEVVDKLPKGDKVRLIDGELKGANPNKEFVGNPYSDEGSFGVFEGPILETIDKFMPGKGVDLTGQSFDSLLDIVRSGKPVMAWTTIEQRQTFHSATWTDDEGNEIKWNRFEHAVVITGIDGENVIVNDPYTGQEVYYNRELFEKNWASMGKRAVTLDVSTSAELVNLSGKDGKVEKKKSLLEIENGVNMFTNAVGKIFTEIEIIRYYPTNFSKLWKPFSYFMPQENT